MEVMTLNQQQFPQYRVIKNQPTADEQKRNATFPGGLRESIQYHYELDSDRREDGGKQ
jgi:hypothetical protein